MKLLGTELGRVVIFFSPEEIRPDRGIPLQKSASLIRERFGFLKFPTLDASIEQMDQEGYKFQQGAFLYEEQECVVSELSIYRDGISVTALRTEYAEAFLDEFLLWGRQTFDLKEFTVPPKKRFLSQVSVEFDIAGESLLQKHTALISTIQRYIGGETDLHLPVYLKRFDLGYAPDEVAGLRPADFVLDRRINVPYARNRFISEAPLRTARHVELLQEIEQLIA